MTTTDRRGRRVVSTRQRMVVLTFPSPAAAAAWDAAGSPVQVDGATADRSAPVVVGEE